MKTQIKDLRSGAKNQILNSEIDYSILSKSTSHVGHAGSSQVEVSEVWDKVISENPEKMKIIIKGVEIELEAKWTLSRKSVSYCGNISEEDLEDKFSLKSAKNKIPTFCIDFGNIIEVSNGKNSFMKICPSLITII